MTTKPSTELTPHHVPVLIVGAGLAGLSAAALLAWRGVPALLVERRASTSRHPRARGINIRSLELLRGIPGLEAELVAAGRTATDDFSIVIAESVTGREFRTLVSPGTMNTRLLSPAAICTAGQDRVEPILLRHARTLGAEIRFSTELAGFRQDAPGVCATLRDTATGEETVVTADYMIAADGNRSRVRRALGIGTHGQGTMSHNMSILFEADLSAALRGRGFVLYYLQNPGFTGAFISTDDPNRGQVSVEYDPERENAADYTPARAAGMVRAALGLPELDVTRTRRHAVGNVVADRRSDGRGTCLPRRRRGAHHAADRRAGWADRDPGCRGPRVETRAGAASAGQTRRCSAPMRPSGIRSRK